MNSSAVKRVIYSICAWVFATCTVLAQQVDLSAGHWVDLSHEYSEQTLYWPTSELFQKETVFEGMTDSGFYYTAYTVKTAEHGGTHIDAPIHFSEGRKSVDRLALSQLIGPAVVIEVQGAAADNADYQVSVEDVHSWERQHGQIPPGSIVLFNTGFAKHWPNATAYLGTDERGAHAVAKLHFPGIHPETASLLLERKIHAVGLDTASIDYGQSSDFMTHRILFEADVPGFENLANLDLLPPVGAFLVALPMKIAGGSGAPLRAVAFVPGD